MILIDSFCLCGNSEDVKCSNTITEMCGQVLSKNDHSFEIKRAINFKQKSKYFS